MIHPARIPTIGIDRPLRQVADFLAEPRNFPRWASGLTPRPGSSLGAADGS